MIANRVEHYVFATPALAVAIVTSLTAPPALAFTPEQAAAGRAVYEQSCVTCHGPNLRQLPGALLAGPEFVAKWGERGTNELLAQTRATMPPDRPGVLSEETYLGLIAYILQSNGGAASAAEPLTAASSARIGAGLDARVAAAAAAQAPAAQPPAAPPEPTGVIVAGTVKNFVPVTDEMLRNPAPRDWLMLRHDYSATSFSPLTQITADNASRLQLAWTWPMRDGGTNQPAPIVYNGTMYLANTGGVMQALDARTGALIWEHHVGADIAPRGLALYGNKLIFQSAQEWAIRPQEARLIALDAATGETIWNVRMPDVYATNSGPLVANGLLIQGMGTLHRLREQQVLHQRVRSRNGRAALALSHGGARWRARRRQLGRPAGSVSRGRGELDHRQLRSRSQPHVLGHHAGEAVDAREPRDER